MVIMSNKRKRNPSRPPSHAKEIEDGTDLASPVRLESVENYPRKRISVAVGAISEL
jgi:hypothetical protein